MTLTFGDFRTFRGVVRMTVSRLRDRLNGFPAIAIASLSIATLASAAASKRDGRPVVAGFERFYDRPEAEADPVRGGTLLLGELNCASCHKVEGIAALLVQTKQAPILDQIGGRVRPDFLRAYLADPRKTKPGTTMPNVFANVPEARAKEEIEALVHFLANTGVALESPVRALQVGFGERVYHQVGCVACHGARKEGEREDLKTSVPLGDLTKKYTVNGLATFLQDPLAIRPSGRMPSLNLKGDESRDVAHFLLEGLSVKNEPNLKYQYYEGEWEKLPDFAKLEPVAQGTVDDFVVRIRKRVNNYALRFEGYLQVDREGVYRFHVASDDGAKLSIDGDVVVDHDGVHSETFKEGERKLTVGSHKLVVEHFNGGGEDALTVEFEGAGIARQSLSPAVTIKPERPDSKPAFRPDPVLVERGRSVFADRGCASCHALKDSRGIVESKLSAKSLKDLHNLTSGCLADRPAAGSPDYALGSSQKAAIVAAIKAATSADVKKPTPRDSIASVLLRLNCYACHVRDGVGGVEKERDAYFTTTQKEMGDEGRLPPHLNGVGGKLESEWLKNILENGSKDRPYMITHMPRFAASNAGSLGEALAEVDRLDPVPAIDFDLPEKQVKAQGRYLVGSKANNCGTCHAFKNFQASGIQAINMTIMTRRLRRDWFHRYVRNPQEYRPGTRMPSAWPQEKSLITESFNGDSTKQIEAVWRYLSDGDQAAVPYGLGRSPIPLVVGKEAVIYRNFIEGAGPRAIGVGYPEKVNIAFDANNLRLAVIWQGDFIDASRHWTGRGEGFEAPLGDDILRLPEGVSVARLASAEAPWPETSARQGDYRFLGYSLAKIDRKPTFHYRLGAIRIDDYSDGIPDPRGPRLKRTLSFDLKADDAGADAYYRAAAGNKIEIDPADRDRYVIDGTWRTSLETSVKPIVRNSAGKAELLVPIRPATDTARTAKIVQIFIW
jgi:mono/diheme cytochrome c family protein